MTCIAVLNLKGGVGKTTLSVHLARGFELAGLESAVLDTDAQRSAMDWSAASDGKNTRVIRGAKNPKDLEKQTQQLATEFDALIIDGAPHTPSLNRTATEAADVVLIPVTPSPLDIWATEDIVEMVRNEKKKRRRKLHAAFVLWRVIPRTKIIEAASAALSAMKLATLKTQIHQRVAYATAMAEGKTVLDIARTGPASEEIRALIQNIEDL